MRSRTKLQTPDNKRSRAVLRFCLNLATLRKKDPCRCLGPVIDAVIVTYTHSQLHEPQRRTKRPFQKERCKQRHRTQQEPKAGFGLGCFRRTASYQTGAGSQSQLRGTADARFCVTSIMHGPCNGTRREPSRARNTQTPLLPCGPSQQRTGDEHKATPVVQILTQRRKQHDGLCCIAGQRSTRPHRLFILRSPRSRKRSGLQRMKRDERCARERIGKEMRWKGESGRR